MAEDRDIVGIAAKGSDVVMDSVQSKLIVQQTIIGKQMPFAVQGWNRQKTEEVQAIVKSDDDGIPLTGEFAAIIVVALAVKLSAAMTPEHDG